MRLDQAEPDVAYSLKIRGAWHTLRGTGYGPSILATADPAISFITEHYWGYTRRGAGRTSEYQVVHVPWQVRWARDARLDGDSAAVYGPEWRAVLTAPPHSAFLAEGSPVAVMGGAGVRA